MKNSLIVGAVLLFVHAPQGAFADGRPCPQTLPDLKPDVSSPEAKLVPDDVCGEDVGVPKNLAYFDDYSWRAFIALVWPASAGKRGEPDPDPRHSLESPREGMPSGSPLVFETYKAEWETFPQAEQAHPTDWDVPDDPADMTSMWTDRQRACHDGSVAAKPGDFFLAPSTKFGRFENVAQAGMPAAVLVAQNGTLVRYLAAYNENAYHYVLSRGLYLAKNLPNDEDHALDFPLGSVTVKSSWIDLGTLGTNQGAAHPETFHRRVAWLYDPFEQKIEDKCKQHIVGLVGLHIVQKTPFHNSWIWSSFEHVDNAPDRKTISRLDPSILSGNSCPTPSNTKSPYSFNDGSGMPMNSVPPTYLVDRWEKKPPPCTPPPVNVERIRAINHDPPEIVTRSTTETNEKWQDELRKENSVWQYYQLVVTQWSVAGRCREGCGAPLYTVPGVDQDNCSNPACNHLAGSAIANASMETWLPSNLQFGCMACHNKVASGAAPNNKDPLDFVFSLRVNAYPSRSARGSIAIRALNLLLGASLQ
jgi:hypothetical protein